MFSKLIDPLRIEAVRVVSDFEPPTHWPQMIAYLPGFSIRAVVLWLCKAPDGGIFVYDEFSRSGLTVEEQFRMVKDRNKSNGRKIVFYCGDPHTALSKRARGSSIARIADNVIGCRMKAWPAIANRCTYSFVDISTPTNPLLVCRRCDHLLNGLQMLAIQMWRQEQKLTECAEFECLRGAISTGFLQEAA